VFISQKIWDIGWVVKIMISVFKMLKKTSISKTTDLSNEKVVFPAINHKRVKSVLNGLFEWLNKKQPHCP